MSFDSVHQLELGLISTLQSLGGPVFNQLMIFCNYFDTSFFYLLVLALVWYAYDQKVGVRLLWLIVLNAFLIQDFKELFAQPRPCQLMPALGILKSKSYGFPSGAAEQMTAIFGFLALSIKRTWFWIAATLFVLLISFSRVYLGLHFPTDILGGWLFGSIFLYCYWKALPRLEPVILQQSFLMLACLSALVTSILYMLSLNTSCVEIFLFGFGANLGIIFGLIWSRTLIAPTNFYQRLIRPSIAYLGFIFLQITCISFISSAILAFLCGFWFSWAVPFFTQQKR
jgi:undecaprenyl-diphosphatase